MLQPHAISADAPEMALESERAIYNRELPSLLEKHAGQFVLIGRGQVIGVFTTDDAAMRAGYAKFGRDAFLVHQISAEEQVHYLFRAGR